MYINPRMSHGFYSIGLLWSGRKDVSNLAEHPCLNAKLWWQEGPVASASRYVLWKVIEEAVGRRAGDGVCVGLLERTCGQPVVNLAMNGRFAPV